MTTWAGFLASLTPGSEETAAWGATFRFRVATYLTGRVPPRHYVTSARAVLIDGDQVITIRGPDGVHIWPGGRIESGETPEDALRRELLEEVGWSLAGVFLLGFAHFHHLTPRPADHPYPYPDFLQMV